jgi:hypothetical protein
MIDALFEATDFRPSSYQPIGGALVYTKYNWLIRLIMKQISRSEGASTDTTRDHDGKSIEGYLAKLGEPSDVPVRSPSRGPPYWKSRALRLKSMAGQG